jgi:hypothetical protein
MEKNNKLHQRCVSIIFFFCFFRLHRKTLHHLHEQTVRKDSAPSNASAKNDQIVAQTPPVAKFQDSRDS